MMDFLFGSRKTPEQQMRECQRSLDRTARGLVTEKNKLSQTEQKIINDIKAFAKKNEMDVVRMKAKDLVRTRQMIKKLTLMEANVRACSLKVVTLKSTAEMSKAMQGVTKSMQRMSASMKLPQLQQIMMEFSKQSEMMDMKEEMMSDAIDDVLDEADTSEQTDLVVDKVLSELGIEMTQEMSGLGANTDPLSSGAAASTERPMAQPASEGADPSDMDLEARLARLKNN